MIRVKREQSPTKRVMCKNIQTSQECFEKRFKPHCCHYFQEKGCKRIKDTSCPEPPTEQDREERILIKRLKVDTPKKSKREEKREAERAEREAERKAEAEIQKRMAEIAAERKAKRKEATRKRKAAEREENKRKRKEERDVKMLEKELEKAAEREAKKRKREEEREVSKLVKILERELKKRGLLREDSPQKPATPPPKPTRKVLISPPHDGLKWNEKQKRWIDQEVTNWFIEFIHRNRGKWTYEPWSGRTDDAWRNGWLDFERLINETLRYSNRSERPGVGDFKEELERKARWTQNQKNYEIVEDSEDSSDTISSYDDSY
jgi:hypothetical protein